ncbi:MAG: hypothetical protein IJZ08_04985 [Clostridia bacterium]|nr:hypothetical protein [Clostridia bacterium]
MKREIPPEERRVVSRRKKIAILAVFVIGLALIVWFKLPFERTYTAALVRTDAGDVELYGETVDVTVTVRVQRYFFRSPAHSGTVTVGNETFSNEGGNLVPTFSLTGAFESTDSFTMSCYEWQGSYVLTRCVAIIDDGEIIHLHLRDKSGASAGQYAQTNDSQ